MNRVMCHDQYGGVRFRPGKGTSDALQAIADMRNTKYGEWAERAVYIDRHHRPALRPPELDLIKVLDKLCAIEDQLCGVLVVPVEVVPEPCRTKRCHQCTQFHRNGNTNWGVCERDGRVRANLCTACDRYERRDKQC